jgi:hypothetical protein
VHVCAVVSKGHNNDNNNTSDNNHNKNNKATTNNISRSDSNDDDDKSLPVVRSSTKKCFGPRCDTRISSSSTRAGAI